MIRAVIYCRCSTEEESQQEALKKQVIEARESVKANGWLMVDEYIESKSGTTAEKRKEYQRLFEDLQSDRFDIVQIKSQDRLMRNTKDWYLFIDRLVTNNKKLYMYMERKFYTPDDALITGIKAILAEEYSKELSKKINNAHRNRQRQGESFILPPGTYGYRRLPDKSIVIVEEEARIIRLIFHLCQSMGCGRIASVLEKEGYRDRNGGVFQEEAVRRIIRNPIRCGTVIQNKRHFDFQLKQELKMPEEDWIVHKEALPAIVSEEIWQEANKAMDRRARKYHTTDKQKNSGSGQFELSGKIHCGLCGGIYYRTYRRHLKDNAKIIEWKCQNYLRYGREGVQKSRPAIRKAPKIEGKGCDNIQLEEQKLIDYLTKVCETYGQNCGLDYPGIMDKALSVLKKVFNRNDPFEKSKELKLAIRKQEFLGEKLMDKLLDGIIGDEDYKRKKAELDEKLQNLKKELAAYKLSEDIQAEVETRIHTIEERLKKDTLRKAALSETLCNIEVIEVFEDRLKIRFYPERPLEINAKRNSEINNMLQDFKDVFVLEVPLNDDLVYASRKEAERNRIIKYMKENPSITAKEIAEIEQISLSAANYRIKKLRQQGRICFEGRGGHGKWAVSESKEES